MLQLSGGNDGLNTVVPFGDDNYYKARPGIGIRQNQLLELGRKTPGIGLHPALDGVKVTGTLLREVRGPKVLVFKFKRRKQYRRKNGHRQNYHRVRIEAIEG
ncbi:MAG: 50S ribosomal protein L21 [Acidobacteriota bacterium]